MKRHLISIVLLALFWPLVSSPADAQKTTPRPKVDRLTVIGSADASTTTPLPPDQQRRFDTFMKAWRTLNDYYFDKTFNGLNWDKVRQDFLPRVSAAKSDAEVHRLIEEMIAKLDRSHFGLIPPEFFANLRAAQKEIRGREKGDEKAVKEPLDVEKDTGHVDDLDADEVPRYGIGIEVRFIDGKFVITSVEQQSGATIAGVKPGYVLEKINGVALSDLTTRLLLAYPNVRHLQRYLPTAIVGLFLNSEHDAPVSLTCLDENDQSREFKVPRLTLSGENITIGERFPAQFLRFKTAALTEDVGYIKFNVFGMPVIGKFCDALSEFSTKKAIIVDLRGNIGGLLGTLIGLSGMLTDKPMTIGTSLYRYRSELIAVKPKAKHFKGKLVFLVDGQTMSAAELFSAGMQEDDRVLVVGERTAGEALPAGSVELPTGAVLVYPMANFRTAKGKFIEGTGVEPNFTVPLDRGSLLGGKDVQLSKALDLIRDGSSFPKPSSAAGLTGDPEPPPPPKKRAPSFVSLNGTGSGLAAPPAAKPQPKDARAIKIISDFTAAVGGIDAAKKMATYEATGTAILKNAGSNTSVGYHVYRQDAGKYSVIMTAPALGEVREVHNGKDVFVQTDFGVDTDTEGFDSGKLHLFSPMSTLSDPSLFTSVSYLGEYDDHGQKLKLIEGTIGRGVKVAMAFDSRTNMLIRCSMTGVSYTLGDYRKVDTLMLPFSIDLEGIMDIKLDSVKLNAKIDPANFQKKEKCFDKPLQEAAAVGK